MKLLLKVLILSAACILIIKSCSPFLNVPNPLIGQPAPDFTLTKVSGQEANMTQYRGGQPAMIFFWATWCPHCRRQLKELTQNRQAIEANGIKIILVNIGESSQKVREYVNANNISSDIFMDEAAETADRYKIVGVPTFFFINREGIVLEVKNVLPGDYQKILFSR
jgi:peroxiredoxin